MGVGNCNRLARRLCRSTFVTRGFGWGGGQRTPQALTQNQATKRAYSALRGTELLSNVTSVITRSAPGVGQNVVEVMLTTNNQTDAFIVDEDGNREPTEIFWAKERLAQLARFKEMSPALFAFKQTLAANQLVDVTISINADLLQAQLPRVNENEQVSLTQYEAWTMANVAAQRRRIIATKQRMRAFLASRGVEIVADPDELPFMDVKMPAGLLDAPEANGNDVISLEKTEKVAPRLHGDLAGMGSMKHNSLIGGVCGSAPCDGGGLTVGIWEWDDDSQAHSPAVVGVVATNNTHIYRGATANATVHQRPPTSCVSQADCNVVEAQTPHWCGSIVTGGPSVCKIGHTSWVAAAVGSYLSIPYAYNSLITSGPDGFPNVPAGTSFSSAGAWNTKLRIANDRRTTINEQILFMVAPASGTPATYVNRSMSGFPTAGNWLGRNYNVFVTTSSGNSGNAATVECGLLANGLCVGMYDYKTWNDLSTHVVNNASSAGNLNSLERPHLLGPGSHSGAGSGLHMPNPGVAPGSGGMLHNFVMLSTSQQILGTSFAAPAVLAAAIQAHQYKGFFSALAFPVVNKAVLLAATQDSNNDGPVGKGNSWSAQPSDAVDGAGQINMLRLKTILDNNRYTYQDLTNASFTSCGTNCRQKLLATIPASADYVPRVALTYQACMANSGSIPVLQYDLDLVVTATGSQLTCSTFYTSNTTNSETEMLEFGACPGARTYSVYVRVKNGATLQPCSTSDTTERVAVAWNLIYKGFGFVQP